MWHGSFADAAREASSLGWLVVNLIHERLRAAQADYEVRYGKKED